MKIFCDYCGNQFDTAQHSTCPSCGGTYEGDIEIKNAVIKQAREETLQRQREAMAMRERQAQIDDMNARNKNKAVSRRIIGIGCLVPFIVSIICFAAIFIVALVEVVNERAAERESDNNNSSSLLEDYEYESVFEEEELPVSADFNEYAETANYSVICDSFEKIDRAPFGAADGYMYVSFHLVVKNTGIGKVNTTSDVICLADGMIADSTWHNDRKELPATTLPAGVSAEGYMCFEVPVDTEEFELRYGDLVTIHIENTLR